MLPRFFCGVRLRDVIAVRRHPSLCRALVASGPTAREEGRVGVVGERWDLPPKEWPTSTLAPKELRFAPPDITCEVELKKCGR